MTKETAESSTHTTVQDKKKSQKKKSECRKIEL
jgi:hypothetical protein